METTKRQQDTYHIDAWRGVDCIGFRTVTRPVTVGTTADHFIIDMDADRVYVHRHGTVNGLMASWNKTGGWTRVDDPALEGLLS